MADKTQKPVVMYTVPFSHRGSTDFLAEESLGKVPWPDYSEIIYLAPTEQKLMAAQKIFHARARSPYIPPRFFTFSRLAQHFFRIEMPARHLPSVFVPLVISELSGHSTGYAAVLSELLKELKQYHPFKPLPQIRAELTETFSNKGLHEDALKRLHDALDVFELYQDLLSRQKLFDDNDILQFGRNTMEHSLSKFSVLIADGFYDMTTAEKNILEVLVSRSGTTLIAVPYAPAFSTGFPDYIKNQFHATEITMEEHPPPDLSYVSYSSAEEEIEGTARHIKNYFVSGRFRAGDFILVTAPRIASYEQLMGRVFRRYGLPCVFSSGKPAAGKAPFRDVLQLLESVSNDYPRLPFTAVLSSPHFRSIPAVLREYIPSLSLRSGILNSRASWENLFIPDQLKHLKDDVREAFSVVFGMLSGLETIRDSSGFDTLSAAVKTLLSALHFDADENDADILNKALDRMSLLSDLFGRKTVSLKKFTDYLRHVLNAEMHVEEGEGIQVMDFFEARGLEPDYLYFCGLKDGDMPSKPPIDHILPDTVRTDFGLISLNQYLLIQKLNLLRLAGASANRHLSYPAMEGDKVFLPSPYLPWGSERTENIFGIFSVAEQQSREGGNLFSNTMTEVALDKKSKAAIAVKDLAMPLRVTDIDQFRKCPRRFFLSRILNLEASEIAAYEPEAKTLGTIVHRIMELLMKEPVDSTSRFQEKALSSVNAVLDEVVMEPYWKQLLRTSFMELLPDIIETEANLRDEGFSPYRLEMNVNAEVLPGISLKGKIDRIDCSGSTCRIIDYKTGTATIGADIIRKGTELQLPLYSAILSTYGMHVDKAGIYSMKDIDVKWIPTKRDKYALDDYIKAALRFLKDTATFMADGQFFAHPLEEFYCNSCPEAPFCPFIHAGPGKTQS